MPKSHTVAQQFIHVVSINDILGGVAKNSVYFVVL